MSGRKDHNLDRCIMYDLCVIGAGCIGSAAARHASQWGRVCLIGPKEPEVSQLGDSDYIIYCHSQRYSGSNESFVVMYNIMESVFI